MPYWSEMEPLEIAHLGASAAGFFVALYVGKSMSQLKNTILEIVKRDYVSKDVAQVEKEAFERLMESIEKHQEERHASNVKSLEDLKAGHERIHERLDDLFNKPENDRRERPRD